MPIMPEIPPRGMDGADFSDGGDRLEEGLEDSEGNGDFQKKVKGVFGEKRLLEVWG